MSRTAMIKLHPPGIRLVVFDKDGTLIEFGAMWGGWIVELARRLHAETGLLVDDALFRAAGFEAATGKIEPRGLLAIGTMQQLRVAAIAALQENGLELPDAETATAAAWHAPDPVALARPRADLPRLFAMLRERGIAGAVATTDDRGPTLQTLHALGIASLVAAAACGDDGLPVKPAPDALLHLCRQLDVLPAQTAMIGDTVADMQMGRAAGVRATIAVLGGVADAATIAPYADVVLPSLAALLDM